MWDGTEADLDRVLSGNKTDLSDHYDAEFPNQRETDIANEEDIAEEVRESDEQHKLHKLHI